MKEMAELLRSGARMLDKSCPECNSPLFQLKSGEIWCANCQRRVVIVQEGEESAAEAGMELESLERALVNKIASMRTLIANENEPAKLKEATEVLDSLLSSLEKARRIRKKSP
ncbi:MAG: hypothetical protein JSV27_04995 [Candidatus Bathyarchaeota archaeon]|nr:MAG: hypothetical protein JSV27_04995 [Candidatus Bathyarchaeota archaeon]